MLPQELIRKKQAGLELTAEELKGFFSAFLSGRVADYQVSALLMAIFFRSMTSAETKALTAIIRYSGEVFTWPELPRQRIVDKHSTGGVGDKTSLLLLPLCLLEGLYVPMIAGRGLGHTGGTLDKLESIAGMRVDLAPEEARRQLQDFGGFIIGQSEAITPLDRRLYALRDVTSTVAAIPLIVASILAKKLAEGVGGLVLDVKFGSGAFMLDEAAAETLARRLLEVARASGLGAEALLSSMDSPLGDYAGNALEIYECLVILEGGGPSDTRELSLELAARMVQLAYPQRSAEEIRMSLNSHLDSGRAHECFMRWVARQGGDTRQLVNKETFRKARQVFPVASPFAAGFVAAVDVRLLGVAIVSLGGGRSRTDAVIDHGVGLAQCKKLGDFVEKGEPLALIYGNNADKVDEAARLVRGAYRLSPTPVARGKLIARLG